MANLDLSSMEYGEEENEKALWKVSFRRELRKQQREIINDVQKRREEITLPDELIKQVNCLDSLNQNVVAPREAAIDSEGFRVLSAIGREQVESVQGELVRFDPVVYAEKLVTYMGGRRGDTDNPREAQLDWSKLGRRSMRVFKKVPIPTFLHGALDLQPLKKRARSARRKDQTATTEVNKPKEVTDFEEEEESTTKDVSHVFDCLKRACKRGERVHYFTFLVDPTSFAHTVENMFHFAFLIKDGRVGVEMGEDGQPYICLPEEVNEVGQSTKSTRNQSIVSFDRSSWERAVEKFGIRKASISQRDY